MRRPLPGWAVLVLGLAGAPGTIATLTPVAPLPPALTTITPDFQWTATGLTAPVSYRLRVSRDPNFAAPFVDTTLTDATVFALRRPIKPYGPIAWRGDATAAATVPPTTGPGGPAAAPA